MKHKKAGLLCRMSRFIENLACHPLRMIDNAVSGGMGVQVLTLAVVVVAILALFATVIAVYTLIAEGRGDFVGSRLWKMYHVFVDPGNVHRRIAVIVLLSFGELLVRHQTGMSFIYIIAVLAVSPSLGHASLRPYFMHVAGY